MNAEAKDLVIVGAGPGGYIAAIRGAQLGRTVTIIEKEALGGVCLNWGCIPSKALLRSAQLYSDLKHADEFGLTTGTIGVDFPKVINRSRDVASKLSNGVTYLMKKNRVQVMMGTAKFLPGNQLTVTDSSGSEKTVSFKDVIIATGARARTLPNLQVDGKVVHTYRTILEHRVLPKKTLIIGAGAIGIEFAYFHATLGAEVTVVEMADQILPIEDQEIAQSLEKILVKKGIKIHTSSSLGDIKRDGDRVTATIKTKNGDLNWDGDCCLMAVGVLPNTEKLGLEDIKIVTDRGFIKVDEMMKTNLPNHYAIGDVVGAPLLAHVASHEGILAAEAACGVAKHGIKYDNIPGCTYCQPQVASVGLTEKAAKAKGLKYRVGKIPFAAIGKAIAIGEPDGMIKVIIDDEVGEVLGVHILHAEATELITEAAIIRSHEGIAASVIDTVHPHPTLSEAMSEAMAAALGRPLNF